MAKVKTSELTGPALDWAVAKCEGWIKGDITHPKFCRLWRDQIRTPAAYPSTDWAQGGQIIQWEGISIRLNHKQAQLWEAYIWLPTQHDQSEADSNSYTAFGMTPLIAAMRCFCCSKLGDVVDIPEELCQQQNS